MSWPIALRFSVAAFCLGALIGCGEKPPPPPKIPDTVPFSGVVKVDGKPVAGAAVTFLSTVDKGTNATGVTDAGGKYDLKIHIGTQEKAGAVPGNYKVQISRFLSPSGEPQDPSKPVEVPGMESLPPRYSNPNNTELTATVAKDGTKDFDLKSK